MGLSEDSRMRFTLILAASMAAVFPAAAQQSMEVAPITPDSYAARAVAGAHVSATLCDWCHMLRQNDADRALPFASIARQRSSNQIGDFLARPHGGTPSIQLSREQIDDVIAYMQSFVPPRGR
jgi:mono/diheme cytochrome c family protein